MAVVGDHETSGFWLSLVPLASLHPIVAGVLLITVPIFAYAFYNLFLHPLRGYPGPLLWRCFRFPYVVSTQRGQIHRRYNEFHAKYGPIVRIAPNELSYADGRAFGDIYANRPGHQPFEKTRTYFKKMTPDEPTTIMDWHEDNHARYRRAFTNAFSEKSLKSQAPIIEQHVDGFMAQLKKRNTVDLTDWFNFLTFDLAGDLTYGESFGCVDNGKAHPWVEIAQDFGKGLSIIAAVNLYPPIDKVLRYIIPKRILQRSVDHRQMSYAQAKKRIARDVERSDWVTPTKKYTDQKDQFTDQEWGMNLLVIAFAGSETTASALTAITRMLVQHRGVLHRLTREVRERFQNESDITVATTSDLPFLNAVIHEGMRLGPPVVIGLPRVVPDGGDLVCDRWVPGGTYVVFNQFSAFRQSYNFSNPNSFIPERFLTPNKNDDMTVFQPFQMGRHVCIGMKVAYQELRLILSRLLWSFDLALKDPSDVWDWGEQSTYIFWEKKPLEVALRHVNK
ncbi:hypothetical protein COCMIDRAFT_101978 [Bipolaris oryzae ATCC 44560]|uniref:Cytochrome P450 n=1 Tax=Bipolaris oryzae ATCC 44560 TaxID=930090 RepID=W6Z612_COCMI|nr:uncharacterized protein COCMIDRAFT_101978 [Bipolaris oryzae ATCC 44560]EUC43004.1 hypothetical protein COCMIDRAFT_101978 [Bipolaris oryzae ATCC 44560]